MTYRPLRLGYLHAGHSRHGVLRYGRLLAEEARRQPSVQVIEAAVEFTSDWQRDRLALAAAARTLAAADLVHLQYNAQAHGSVWGPGWRQLHHLWSFARRLRRPIVATLHDVYEPAGRGVRARCTPPALALRLLGRLARLWLVSSEEERTRLLRALPGAGVHVIPHFVEARTLPADRVAARRALGLAGARVVTLLGYIHRRKGYRLLLEALPGLPSDVILIFAGEPVGREPARDLQEARLRYGARVRITGYLPESRLGMYLAATDLAVCPFGDMSASGSLATWISAGRPIVASDLPQIAEYYRIAPGTIRIFRPHTGQALGSAVSEALASEGSAAAPAALVQLREALSLPRIVEAHRRVYTACAELPGNIGLAPTGGATEHQVRSANL